MYTDNLYDKPQATYFPSTIYIKTWVVYNDQCKQASFDQNSLYNNVYSNNAYCKNKKMLQNYWHTHHDLAIKTAMTLIERLVGL